jgi:hypothetical protein
MLTIPNIFCRILLFTKRILLGADCAQLASADGVVMRRTLRLREFRQLHLVVIGMLLWSTCPAPTMAQNSFPLANAAPAQTPPPTQELPPPEVHPYVAPIYPAQPGVSMTVAVTPDPVTVGITATVVLTITNQSETAATDVVVELPLPAGVDALPETGNAPPTITKLPVGITQVLPPIDVKPTLAELPRDTKPFVFPSQTPDLPDPPTSVLPSLDIPPAGPIDPTIPAAITTPVVSIADAKPAVAASTWKWQIQDLPGQSLVTVRVDVRISAPLPEHALLLEPRLTASNVPEPIVGVGGAVFRDVGWEQEQSTVFTPGTTMALTSVDRTITLTIPDKAADQSLTVRVVRLDSARADLQARGRRLPTTGPLGRGDLDPFVLEARDSRAQDVRRFAAPLTITVQYTPAQLRVRGITPGGLTLFWYDEDVQRWQPLDTTIDTQAQTAQATVNHFTIFALANGLSASAAFVPSLQGFQVSDFTGAATYSYPMTVPTGQGGLTPTCTSATPAQQPTVRPGRDR